MILADLLIDADKAGDVAGAYQVLLATRTVDDQELATGQVQLMDIGAFQIDSSAREIDLLPSQFAEPSGGRLTIADIRNKLGQQPELGDFALSGVIAIKRLADGGKAQRTDPIIGTYTVAEDREIWLLLHPQHQWPDHWFGT